MQDVADTEETGVPGARSTSRRSTGPPGARRAANLLDVIEQHLPGLRDSERKVGEAVLRDPAWAIHASMAATARAAGVSDPTVMRFCAAVGCESFQGFRLRLAQSLAFGVPATHSVIRPGDSEAEVASKLFDYTMTSLDRARRSLDMMAVRRAIELLSRARRIEFYGHGASGIICQDAQQKFPLFGVPCIAHADGHQQFMSASMLGPGDVAVVVSNTGQTSSVVECARRARASGAAVIGICGTRGLLAGECTVTIVVETLENTDLYTPTTSRIAGLVVIDLLAIGVALRHDPSYIKKLQDMKRGLTAMRTAPIGTAEPRPVAPPEPVPR
jgi:RpiR family carbohydrate utilization transcriptional regulator